MSRGQDRQKMHGDHASWKGQDGLGDGGTRHQQWVRPRLEEQGARRERTSEEEGA